MLLEAVERGVPELKSCFDQKYSSAQAVVMALYVDEGVIEGKISIPEESDLDNWLTNNRLKRLSSYFVEEDVVLEDLGTYNEQTIWFVIMLLGQHGL